MEIIKPKNIKNTQYYFIGRAFRILNCIRHRLFGSRTPRDFSISQFDRAVDYDFQVVENWIKYLCKYSKESNPLKDRVVLELGVGPDLGIGLILLATGIKKYVALDVQNLAKSTPKKYYEKLFIKLKEKYPNCSMVFLKEQLDKCYKGKNDRINYIVDKDFKITRIRENIDIVFSQAAFEHFTDVERTLAELSSIVRNGGLLVTEIDLKTHTRWIKDRDPLNIYRYNDLFWNLFTFKDSPNRIRAFEYKELLEKNGWFNIEIVPLTVLDNEYMEKVKPSLNKYFRKMDSSEMKMLNIMLMATKK
jgi:SAM-dependent methyltransferase